MTDRTVVLVDVKTNSILLKKYPQFKDDLELVIYAVKQQGYALKYASKSLQSNLEIVLFAVKQNGLALEYASYDLQCNIDVILTAMNQNKYAFEYIGKEVYYDHIMMHSIVKIYDVALCYASPLQIITNQVYEDM